ncbi:hypothetical protein EJ08DRAFT_212710 [Tothia fuscella]|uniref:Uncharacterized protein n=1 Tax=Tothia fuscella TaxID=1048955 RepID=A0A9P4NSG9_9PEZI|nr:hypothetical protein EJ08DRAFT_212710 [Tothia fuscella]
MSDFDQSLEDDIGWLAKPTKFSPSSSPGPVYFKDDYESTHDCCNPKDTWSTGDASNIISELSTVLFHVPCPTNKPSHLPPGDQWTGSKPSWNECYGDDVNLYPESSSRDFSKDMPIERKRKPYTAKAGRVRVYDDKEGWSYAPLHVIEMPETSPVKATPSLGAGSNTSVRSVMTLPNYKRGLHKTKSLSTLKGERGGIDAVPDFSKDHDVEYRWLNEEIEALYQREQAELYGNLSSQTYREFSKSKQENRGPVPQSYENGDVSGLAAILQTLEL